MNNILINSRNNGFIDISIKDNSFDYYLLEGRSNLFNYEVLDTSNDGSFKILSTDYSSYIDFRIACIKKDDIISINKYVYNDKNIDVNILLNNNFPNNDLEVNCLNSFKGASFSILNSDVYDLYILYEVVNNTNKFLVISDDFQITSEKIKKGHYYYIEAYSKDENNCYIPVNKSNIFECKFKRFEFDINKCDLTICIPVYNGYDFLPRTLDSVLFSNLNQFKILICDDGSTDKTNDLYKWYSKHYDFISYIPKENTGVSDTRNVLLENVDTKYMAFLDSDDIVHPQMYYLLHKYIVETDSDVSIAKTLVRENDVPNCLVLNINDSNGYVEYTYDEMFKEYDNNTFNNIFFVAVWNKIVKTEMARKVKFPEWRYFEDSAYTAALYSYINKFVFVCKALYIWDKRKRSSVGTYSTSYNQLLFKDNINYYYNSITYPIAVGNKERDKYTRYNAIKELIIYYDKISYSKDEAILDYENKLYNLIKDTDISDEIYVNKQTVYNSISNLINKKEQ